MSKMREEFIVEREIIEFNQLCECEEDYFYNNLNN